MAFGDRTRRVLACYLLDVWGKRQDREQLTDLALGLAGFDGKILLAEFVRLLESRERIGEVKRLEVRALPVLHDLSQEHFLFVGVLNPAGKLAEPGFLGRTVSSFACNDLVAVLLL